jgi:hypothetical protein
MSRFILILALILFASCGSNKKLSETLTDKSQIEKESLSKIDTSKSFSFNDSLKISTEITVREYELVTFKDTLITYVKREVTETTTAEQGTSENETQRGESLTSENETRDRDIHSEKKEKKEPYDPDWVKYLFWILLLIVIVSAFFYLKKYLRIFQK